MPFTISVMKLWNGPDIDDIKSKKSLPIPRQFLINPKITQLEPFILELLRRKLLIARVKTLIIFADENNDRMVMRTDMCIRLWRAWHQMSSVSMRMVNQSHRIKQVSIGWMVLSGPKTHVKGYIEGLNMLSNMRLCSNVLGQQVVHTSLGGHQSVDEFCLPGGRI